ncbi:PepSY domain-containing protein [Phenylobacterium sp. J426]|uniref:PepSY domain-containing protein n=1 Tax=Phenylobacterium sp. J426 TaxID=2898439 RepID=UPI002150E5CE|nr:PepSY domain-containing protein [Phenylobacterium sp. J426]MCR5873107.1 PepSY domain-containing protein [Phenylobacterium sp. J426]
MTWSPMFLIRWLHKWSGLVLGLQFLLWALSGAVMALLDHHKVSGEHALAPPAELPAAAALLPLTGVAGAVGEPITKLRLKPLYDSWVYEVSTPLGVRVINATTGQPVVIDAAKARELAVAGFTGYEPPKSVTYVAKSTLETRDLPLPVWRVEFADKERHALLVSASTGEVLAAKNDTWRLWDVAWMLHIMDYDDRQSFNHPLIVTLATGATWLALSGLILLFRSFRRSDVAWILDPLEALAERRRAKRTAPLPPAAKDSRPRA